MLLNIYRLNNQVIEVYHNRAELYGFEDNTPCFYYEDLVEVLDGKVDDPEAWLLAATLDAGI